MYKYTLIRSERKSFAIEVNTDGEVKVRVPKRATMRQVDALLSEKEAWISRSIDKMLRIKKTKELTEPAVPKFTLDEVEVLKAEAISLIEPRAKFWSEKIGVSYMRIAVRGQKTRWGSCSVKGNLNFNYLLALCPEEVMEYVIVHELCHRIHMNHSKRFWEKLGEFYPNYKSARAWLRTNGRDLMNRLP